MPFIVHCPHADCRKFMLLEDSTRGTTVECLLCKKPIKIDAAPTSAPPPLKAPWSASPPPRTAKDDQPM